MRTWSPEGPGRQGAQSFPIDAGDEEATRRWNGTTDETAIPVVQDTGVDGGAAAVDFAHGDDLPRSVGDW